MTTVVYHKHQGLFADRRTTDGLTLLPDMRKIHRVGPGTFAAQLSRVGTSFRLLKLVTDKLANGLNRGEFR